MAVIMIKNGLEWFVIMINHYDVIIQLWCVIMVSFMVKNG